MRDMAKNTSSGRGPNQRQLRVGELIRRTLSDVLMRGDVHDPDLNRFSVTVGEVVTTSDYKIATVYVLPLGGQGVENAGNYTFIAAHKGGGGGFRGKLAAAAVDGRSPASGTGERTQDRPACW